MAKKRAKAKKTVKKKTAKKKAPVKKTKKKARSKQPGKRNMYARESKERLAKQGPSLHTNGLDLTDRQVMFVDHYLGKANLNATLAAKLAGYAPHSAHSQATVLMANPRVKKYLRDRMDNRTHRLELDQNRILRELTTIAHSRPGEFAVWRNGRLTIKDSKKIPAYLQGAIKGLKPVVSKGEVVALEITFYDKLKAAELLMRHTGMLEKMTREGSKGVIVEFMEQVHAQAKALVEGKTQ